MLSYSILCIFCLLIVFGLIQAHVNPTKYNAKENSREYVAEIAVVVDQKTVERYGDDLRNFVLLTMASASDQFVKTNLGHNLRLSVTNIIQLKSESSVFPKPGNKIGKYFLTISMATNQKWQFNSGTNGNVLLSKFCEYMGKDTQWKYDATILLTGSDIFIWMAQIVDCFRNELRALCFQTKTLLEWW